MNVKHLFTILISVLFFINCEDKNDSLTKKDKKILTECFNAILEGAPYLKDSTHIINPHFGKFEFNKRVRRNYDSTDDNFNDDDVNYFNEKILNKAKISKTEFLTIQKKVNDKFENTKNPFLYKITGDRKSKRIITFSGISDKIFFVEYITYLEEIDLEKLKDNKILIDEIRIKDIMSYVFILDDNKIEEEFIDGSIVFERW